MTHSSRQRAWRNTLVVATNEAIRHGLFRLQRQPFPGQTFRFDFWTDFDGDIPGIAHVVCHDGSEIFVNAALWPTPDADRWIQCANAGFLAGDLYACGWLDTSSPRWLAGFVKCRRGKQFYLDSRLPHPDGYPDPLRTRARTWGISR